MRFLSALALAAAVLFAPSAAFAQAAPNLAGHWTLVPDANAPAGGRGGGFGGGLGNEATITQDAKTLTVSRSGPDGTPIKSVYNLDGTESKNTMNFGGNAFDQVSKVKVDAGKLVITTTADFGGNAFETSMTWSLDATGNLVVESSRPDFQGGGAPVVTQMTYKKH